MGVADIACRFCKAIIFPAVGFKVARIMTNSRSISIRITKDIEDFTIRDLLNMVAEQLENNGDPRAEVVRKRNGDPLLKARDLKFYPIHGKIDGKDIGKCFVADI
jgi:hypothetical protein